MFGQHIGQWGPCRQGVRIDLHHLAVRGVDKGRVPRREVAEALAAAVEHLHSRDLVTRKTHHQVMRQLGVFLPIDSPFGRLHGHSPLAHDRHRLSQALRLQGVQVFICCLGRVLE